MHSHRFDVIDVSISCTFKISNQSSTTDESYVDDTFVCLSYVYMLLIVDDFLEHNMLYRTSANMLWTNFTNFKSFLLCFVLLTSCINKVLPTYDFIHVIHVQQK